MVAAMEAAALEAAAGLRADNAFVLAFSSPPPPPSDDDDDDIEFPLVKAKEIPSNRPCRARNTA